MPVAGCSLRSDAGGQLLAALGMPVAGCSLRSDAGGRLLAALGCRWPVNTTTGHQHLATGIWPPASGHWHLASVLFGIRFSTHSFCCGFQILYTILSGIGA